MIKDPIIKLDNVSFKYELVEEDENAVEKVALSEVSFEIERGSFVALVGPNGSGKSTLAKHLNALLIPTEGSVFVEGMDTREEDPIKIRSLVGMVFQNPDNQLVSSIVEDDVAFGPENIGVESSEIRKRVDEALQKVSMYEHRKKGPHLLSGGQKQRVAIAGVLAMKTECIVFDEPTAMLDPSGRAEIMEIIKELHKENKTVVLITHFMEEAALADRIILINGGRILADGSPLEIFKAENESKLKDNALELPFAAEMANELRRNGMAVPDGIITEEQLADYLCKSK